MLRQLGVVIYASSSRDIVRIAHAQLSPAEEQIREPRFLVECWKEVVRGTRELAGGFRAEADLVQG